MEPTKGLKKYKMTYLTHHEREFDATDLWAAEQRGKYLFSLLFGKEQNVLCSIVEIKPDSFDETIVIAPAPKPVSPAA